MTGYFDSGVTFAVTELSFQPATGGAVTNRWELLELISNQASPDQGGAGLYSFAVELWWVHFS